MKLPTSALAYFPEIPELRRQFPTWPDTVFLALFLRSDGACAAVPFVEAERHCIGVRLSRMFGQDVRDIACFPKCEGHPTVSLYYSDEQQLLHLLASVHEERILGPVQDYALNDLFAREEGIDPLALLENVKIPLVGEVELSQEIIEAPVVEPDVPSQPDQAEPPDGYLHFEEAATLIEQAKVGELSLDMDGRLILRPADKRSELVHVPHERVYVRKDFQGLALRGLSAQDAESSLCLPQNCLPTALRPRPDGSPLTVDLCWAGSYLFVSFANSELRSPEPSEPVQKEQISKVQTIPIGKAPRTKRTLIKRSRRKWRPKDCNLTGLSARQRMMLRIDAKKRTRTRRLVVPALCYGAFVTTVISAGTWAIAFN